jgi:hypothetical protein
MCTAVRRPVLVWLPVFALGAVACSSSSGGGSSDTPDGGIGCTDYPHIESYSAGMGQMGKSGLLRFELVDANPAPISPATEIWTIKILDASGTPVTDATFPAMNGTIINPRAWMPQMGHGGTITSNTMITNNHDGTYGIGVVDLFMEGVWEVDIAAQSGSMLDATSFYFCLN